MRKLLIFLFCLLLFQLASAQSNWKHGRLQATKDGHYLQFEDGTPFFWLGDTGWEIFSRLTLEEMKMYLDNRAAKGYNVIQVVALSEHDMSAPGRTGQLSLHDSDPAKPNEKFFKLVDTVIQYAMTKNIFIALVPTWADKVSPGANEAPAMFDSTKAYGFGKFLGNRYKTYPNIIWLMGGDRPPVQKEIDYRSVWRAMAQGVIDATDHKCLITYHPSGARSSSQYLHNEKWLDFNMIQSSHGRRDAPNWDMIKKDRELLPTKPTLDGEPNYEDHPVNPWPKWNADSGYFRDYDVRKQIYRSVFAGAFGVTYGHHAIWQFVNKYDAIINYADRGWINAMDRPGAFQAGYLKKLIESRPQLQRIPDSSIVLSGQGINGAHIEAFRSIDNSYTMIYLPIGKTVSVNTSFLKASELAIWWFNPKNMETIKVGIVKNSGKLEITAPTTGIENDWVLIVDDASKKFKEPGK